MGPGSTPDSPRLWEVSWDDSRGWEDGRGGRECGGYISSDGMLRLLPLHQPPFCLCVYLSVNRSTLMLIWWQLDRLFAVERLTAHGYLLHTDLFCACECSHANSEETVHVLCYLDNDCQCSPQSSVANCKEWLVLKGSPPTSTLKIKMNMPGRGTWGTSYMLF